VKIKNIILVVLLLGIIGFKSYSQTKTVYMVADAHLDTQWDWDVQTTIDQYLKNTLNDNFALFRKYPNYKFNFEGAIKYMWFKEYYPDLYAQLKTYVASGQWNIAGSSLDANDIIVPSTESQIRNILIGQTFYKKEFGVKSNDIFLPDCFGFGYTLPTIMNHCGLIGFSTQKLSWGGIITPFKIGAWQGVDGSKIMAVASAGGYGDRFAADLSTNKDLMGWANETGTKTGGKHYIAYRYYGTGDRGGAPEDATVGFIEKGITAPAGSLVVKSATSSDMYNQYFPYLSDFPQYNGELIMTTHGTGCYTSKTMLKRWNRKNELLADAAERSAVIADWLGGLNYPAADLNDAWIKLIWHQFHDDLTGTSIPRAYTFTYNDEVICQNKFATVLKNAVGAGVRSLNTQVKGKPIVVYNPLSIDREDVVEVNLKASAKTDYIKVFNKQGVEVPAQVITSNDTLVKFIFTAAVKSLGYEVYDAQPSSAAPANNENMKISSNSLENSVYKVTIDANGDISSIVDKLNANMQLLSNPVRLALFNDNSTFWPSWEIQYATLISSPRSYVDGAPIISIEEQGPVRVTLKITRTKDNSTFVQYIRLTNSDTKKRIDIENDVNWKTQKTLLKAVFPLAVSNLNATYDLGIGVIIAASVTKCQLNNGLILPILPTLTGYLF
jgi:alpha-mannosidase